MQAEGEVIPLNTRLAQSVTQALIEAKLIPSDREAEVTRRLMAGDATAENWRSWVGQAAPLVHGEDCHV